MRNIHALISYYSLATKLKAGGVGGGGWGVGVGVGALAETGD